MYKFTSDAFVSLSPNEWEDMEYKDNVWKKLECAVCKKHPWPVGYGYEETQNRTRIWRGHFTIINNIYYLTPTSHLKCQEILELIGGVLEDEETSEKDEVLQQATPETGRQ